jgi:uncharacterized membrane protein YeaQ/YmgE (transglycosylase-associated protein family)
MNEHMLQMGPMWILAGLSAGWLAETFIYRRGYGLIVDLGLGVGAGVAGGSLFLAFSGLPAGMLGMFVVGFVSAAGMILAQRLCWPCAPGARERKARLRLVELRGRSLGEDKAASGLPTGGAERSAVPVRSRALARMATTGIYLLRGVSLDLQRAARVRAVSEGTTLGQVLVKGLGEYAAGTWTPRPDDKLPAALNPVAHAAGR